MSRLLSLRDLVREVVAAIQHVDEHVLSTDYIKWEVLDLVRGTEANGYDYSDPEAHLEDFDDLRYWEQYFEHVLGEWQLDVDGERMSEAQLNFIIDRLTPAASLLDFYGSLLVDTYRNIPDVPGNRIQGILRRQAVLNGFLNSAEIGLEHYYRSVDYLKDRPLRQRRPLPEAGRPAPRPREDSIDVSTFREEGDAPATARQKATAKALSILTSNSTLIGLTTLVTVASGMIQAYGYHISTSASTTGSNAATASGWGSAEFFNTLQSALMQLLGLYVTILPAIRHKSLQSSSYRRWSWVLAAFGLSSPFLAMGYFSHSTAVSQLVLFLGAAVQSTIILQLVMAVDSIADRPKKEARHRR